MKKNKIKSIIKNELKIASKDKLNNFFVYILPLLVVPILVLLFSLIMYSAYKVEQNEIKDVEYKIGINFKNDILLDNIIKKGSYKINFITYETKDLEKKLESKEIDSYIKKIMENNKEEYIIYHSDYNVENKLEEILKEYRVGKILEENKIDSTELNKIKITEEFIEKEYNLFDYVSISDLIISLFITIIFFAIYVMGLSIIAQEKERHTLETLLSFPLSIKEVLLGKYLALSIQALKATIICSISTIITSFIALKIIDTSFISNLLRESFPNLFTFFIILIIIGTILSFLLSYLMIFFTSEADSYKKADYQILSIALIFIIILTIKRMVDINKIYTAFIPFINLFGIVEQLFSNNINIIYYLITIVSSVLYTIFFTSIFINDINIEKILFGKIETKKKIDKIIIKQNDIGIKKTLTLILIGMFISIILSLAFSFNSLISFIASQLGLLLTFVIGYKISKVNLIKQFKLNGIKLLSFISYLMIFIFIYISGNLITNLIAINMNIDTKSMDYIITFIKEYKLLSIFIVALLPAIVEEIICRGILLNNLYKKYNIVISIIISSLIFGIMHMNLFQFIYTFILGIFLAYIYHDSKNIFIPILFHFINNLLGVILNMIQINISNKMGWILLIISFITLFIGMIIIIKNILKKDEIYYNVK